MTATIALSGVRMVSTWPLRPAWSRCGTGTSAQQAVDSHKEH
ncbi:hypothetical protein AB0M48_44890 [Lentzea sp. NPDC051208]